MAGLAEEVESLAAQLAKVQAEADEKNAAAAAVEASYKKTEKVCAWRKRGQGEGRGGWARMVRKCMGGVRLPSTDGGRGRRNLPAAPGG